MKSTRQKTPIKVTPRTPIIRPISTQNLVKDPVQVYCRVRPMQNETNACLKVKSPTTVVLTPPEIATNYKITTLKETQYFFKRVFDDSTNQRECFLTIAQPLVEGLVRGKNGLLFTYGVTGSGKTYTMTGNHQQQGIMPRCMDVLFKTISDYQAMKYVFKPDRMNGFEIQSEADAMLDRQVELNGKLLSKRRKIAESDSDVASQASADVSGVSGVQEDSMYAVFVTYVEVYNNSVFDLLESGPIQKTLQSKIIREDSSHNMYVHGVTEIEIKSVEEAIDVFHMGQKRKRMGHTLLNAESSRSHAVFTVRLVQAPTDKNGEYVLQDKNVVTVSQLSLVDLAGSERTSRTNNTGQRLREAGNINNSLMTLRNCLEILRENQTTGTTKKVPYREAKVTHMFKNYFEGEGQVRMIVCVNPRAEDYDETVQVLKFAEMTQDVQVSRPTPMKIDAAGLTPGRRKANHIYKLAINNLAENGLPQARELDIDLGLVYSLGPSFPDLKMNSPESNRFTQELMQHLEQRIHKRRILQEDLTAREDKFRMNLVELVEENIRLKSELTAITTIRNQDRQKITTLENKIVVYESSIDEFNRKLRDREEKLREYQRSLNEKQQQLCEKEREKEKEKKKFNSKLAVETEKMSREMEQKIREQSRTIKEKAKMYEGKLKMVSDIIQSPQIQIYRSSSSESIPTATQVRHYEQNENVERTTHTIGHGSRTPGPGGRPGVAAANIRHRRSRSTGEKWLEHRAANPVPLDTILQPYLKNRKSVTKLTDVRDVTGNKISNYCLISQGADTDGEVETKLYKGNIIPTTGGGAQVVFNDVECLKQKSPSGSPMRKRSSHGATELPAHEVAAKCTVGIEGHQSNKKPRL